MKLKKDIIDLAGAPTGKYLYFIDDALSYRVIGSSGNFLLASRDLDDVEDEYEYELRTRTFWVWPQRVIMINAKTNKKGEAPSSLDLRIKGTRTKLLNGLNAGTIKINNPKDLQLIEEALD